MGPGDNIERGLIALIAILVASALLRHSFLLVGEVLYASVISYLLAFLITIHYLGRAKVGNGRYFIGLYSVISGIWLYELVYHYMFPAQSVVADLLSFTTIISGTLPLIWTCAMIALPFIAYRHMRLNAYFAAGAAFTAIVMAIWYLAGFPQFIAPQWYPLTNPVLVLIPPQYAHTDNQAILYWGFVLNSLSKLLSVLPAMLFIGAQKRGRGNGTV